jgi:hypothetical protein
VGEKLLRRVLDDLGMRDSETLMPEMEKDPALQQGVQMSMQITSAMQAAQMGQMAQGMAAQAQGGGNGGGPPQPGQEQQAPPPPPAAGPPAGPVVQ